MVERFFGMPIDNYRMWVIVILLIHSLKQYLSLLLGGIPLCYSHEPSLLELQICTQTLILFY
uniref:Uncharacterized protein n=1 Tax=Rhizophora mucronata TaxID=61149 RepID=A0A2P2NK80_RHIMU